MKTEKQFCPTCKTNTLNKCPCEKCERFYHPNNCYCPCHKVKPEGVAQTLNGERVYGIKDGKLLKVKPEGVGEWRDDFASLMQDMDTSFLDDKKIKDFISSLLLQEKAKWKEKILNKLREVVKGNDDGIDTL